MSQQSSAHVLFLKPGHQQYQITWELITKAEAAQWVRLGPIFCILTSFQLRQMLLVGRPHAEQ